MGELSTRRAFLITSGVACASLIGGACKKDETPPSTTGTTAGTAKTTGGTPGERERRDGDELDVGATEDLMRDHGVIREALVVFRESAIRLRAKPASLAPELLQRTAKILRSFGQDYHERKLEEEILFPSLVGSQLATREMGVTASTLVDVLLAQHQRGRELVDHVLAATQAAKIGAKATQLAGVLEGFARMYEAHAAREDTVVFPAWKKVVGASALEDLGERFEEIEHATVGRDGFDVVVGQLSALQRELGIYDLAHFTPPAPPRT